MTTDREVNAIVRAWLQEGRTRLPDPVLDRLLDQVADTTQRRSMRALWRSNVVKTLRAMLATAAVVVIAVVAINLTASPNVATDTTPPPNSPPTQGVPPSPMSIARGGTGQLEPGVYVLHEVFPFRMTFTVPSEWEIYEEASRNFVALYKESSEPPNGRGVILGIFDDVNADACDPGAGLLDPRPGPAPRDFAIAVSSQRRTDATPITDVSLSGFSGSYVELTTTGPETDCSNMLQRWPTAAGDRWGLPNLRDRLWILDVDGHRLVIDAWDFPEASDADLAEVRAVVESIEIE